MRKTLSAAFVRNISKPGKYGDLHGLILLVRPSGSKYWFWRGTVQGRRVDYGIGSYPYVGLAEARQKAFDYRKVSKEGGNPKALLSRTPTFSDALEHVIEIHRKAWKPGGRTEKQWRTELATYALPRLGRKLVNRITTAHVMAVLTPIWTEKPVVAKRLRQRIGAVMKWAVAQGYREDNPAGDALGAALPKHNGRKKHFKALPYAEVGQAIAKVQGSGGWPGVRLAFEFLVLTAVRTKEVREATWEEIEGDTWVIPPERMKTGREHRVPLSSRARQILDEAAERFGRDGFLFPGRTGKAISATTLYARLKRLGIDASVHGFRSSFRVWCGDTGVDRELAERALAHTVRNPVEAAYARGTMFERRRRLMADWAEYVAGGH